MTRDEAIRVLESGEGDVKEAQLVLQEMGVRSLYSASMAAELAPMIRDWARERGFEGDVSEVLDGVGAVLDGQIKRIGERSSEYWQQLALWLRGYEVVGVGMSSLVIEDRWALVRKAIRDYLESVSFSELSVLPESKGLAADLKPLVKELKKESMRVVRSGEMAGDKVLGAFRDIVRLYGQSTGELNPKVDVSLGPSDVFLQLLQQPRGSFTDKAIEGDYDLIE